MAFYPQFSGIPSVVLNTTVEEANLRFEDCLDAAEKARRLYTAHNLTLWAQTAIPVTGSETVPISRLAGAGVAAQALSKSVGGVSISKSEGSALASIAGYGELKQTEFGLQLIQLLKIATAGGKYIPKERGKQYGKHCGAFRNI